MRSSANVLLKTKWRVGNAGREEGKLLSGGGRSVYGISPVSFSLTLKTPLLLLHLFNLCQPLSAERQEGRCQTQGRYSSLRGVGTTSLSVDVPPLHNPGPFPVPGFPPNTKQTSPWISALFRTGCAGSEVLHPFLDSLAKAWFCTW